MCKCKRCGRVLKSPESVKRGYGETCYRIVQLQKTPEPEVKPEVNSEVNSEIAFLKLEIRTLKRMFKQIQLNGSVKPIERIKREVEVIPDAIRKGFGNVVKEMKSIFNENFHYTDILKPAVREYIESPPVLA